MKVFLHRARPILDVSKIEECFIRALAVDALGLETWDSDGIALESKPIWDQPALINLHTELNELIDSNDGVNPAVLAEMTLLIAKSPIVFAPRGAFIDRQQDAWIWANEVAKLAAFIFTSFLALATNITTRSFKVAPFLAALSKRDVSIESITHFIFNEISNADRRPVILILTPFSDVKSDQAHEKLLIRARAIASGIRELTDEVQILIPGENFPPSTTIRGDAGIVYSNERSMVISADLVFVVADKYDSWGAATCISWAESTDTPVLVLKKHLGNLSRILMRGFFRTEIELQSSLRQDVELTKSFFLENRKLVWEHSQRTHQFRLRMIPYLPRLFAALDRRGGLVPKGITRERINSIRNNPDELRSFTVPELKALSDHLGPEFDDLFTAVIGRDWSAGTFTVEMLHSLKDFIFRTRVTPTELIEMLELAAGSASKASLSFAASSDSWELRWSNLLTEIRTR